MQQNEKILSLIKSQTVKLTETIEADKLAPNLEFSKKVVNCGTMFPIKSMEDLDKMEAFINDSNLNELVN